MSEPIDLDSYIARRYGVAIDQIREMDEKLAEVIRAGVAMLEAQRLMRAGVVDCVEVTFRESPVWQAMAFVNPDGESGELICGKWGDATFDVFPPLWSALQKCAAEKAAHLIEAEEPAAP